MPTTNTRTIKSAGGDYTSLSAWEAGRQADLVAGDIIEVAECYSMADTTNVIINGWTTDATRYIRVYTPAAERHDGKWNTAKYYLSVNSNFAVPMRIFEDYVRLEGLQIEWAAGTAANGASAVVIASQTSAAGSYLLFDSCICKTASTRANFAKCFDIGAGTNEFRNCVGYLAAEEGILFSFQTHAPTGNVYNCVFTQCNIGISRTSGTIAATNCYCGANTTADYNGTITLTTCASSDTTGSASLQSIAHATGSGAYFTNISAGTEDYHIGASSALKDVGTDLSGTFTTDIDGQTRSGTWDVGIDEIISASATYSGWMWSRGGWS